MNKPGEINVLRNTMTLDGSLHTAFASFQLTLELGYVCFSYILFMLII